MQNKKHLSRISKRAEQLPLEFGEKDKWNAAVSKAQQDPAGYVTSGMHLDQDLDSITFKLLQNMIENSIVSYNKLLHGGYFKDNKFHNMNFAAMKKMLESFTPEYFLMEEWWAYEKNVPKNDPNVKALLDYALNKLAEDNVGAFYRFWEENGYNIEIPEEAADKARDTVSDMDPKDFFDQGFSYVESLSDLTPDFAVSFATSDPEEAYDYIENHHDIIYYAGDILAVSWAKSDPEMFFTVMFEDRERLKDDFEFDIPERAIKIAGQKLAETNPDEFFELGLHRIPELQHINLEEMDPRKLTMDENLLGKYKLTTNIKEQNFVSIKESNYEDLQRHPLSKELDRYDFAINPPIGNKDFFKIYNDTLEEYSEVFHDIGVNSVAKSFALVAFKPENATIFVEEIQSDWPSVLYDIARDADNKKILVGKYGLENYKNFMKEMSEHLASYPYIIIQKLADFAKENGFDTIKISSPAAIESMTGGVGNKKKLYNVYYNVPSSLGFIPSDPVKFINKELVNYYDEEALEKSAPEKYSWYTYSGDMQQLSNSARDMAKRSVSNIYKKQDVSKRDITKKKPKLVDIEKIRPIVENILGDRAKSINFSNNIGDLMKSIQRAQKDNVITNKEKNRLTGIITKYVVASLDKLIVKVSIPLMESLTIKRSKATFNGKKMKPKNISKRSGDVIRFPKPWEHGIRSSKVDEAIRKLPGFSWAREDKESYQGVIDLNDKEKVSWYIYFDNKMWNFKLAVNSSWTSVVIWRAKREKEKDIVDEAYRVMFHPNFELSVKKGLSISDEKFKEFVESENEQGREVPLNLYPTEEGVVRLREVPKISNRETIDKEAKVTSDKPAYQKKEKSDSGGTIYRYDEKHVEKRWKEKKDKLKKLEKDIKKVRTQYKKDLKSDDERTRAIAAIVGIMDETAMRIGNEPSAKEGTYGASTLKVKHVKSSGGKMKFDFPGKGAIEQHVELSDSSVQRVIKELMKGKKKDDFIFEVDGKKIWDRAVNRYLKPLGISAKDLRGFQANKLMKDMLKKKDFKDALKEVAEIVGHEEATLKNQYLDPELVEKHEKKNKKEKKAYISIRSTDEEPMDISFESLPEHKIPQRPFSSVEQQALKNINIHKNVTNFNKNMAFSPEIQAAWRFIAPFLPEGTHLTSGFRSDVEQAKIILDFYLSSTKNGWNKDNGWYHKTFSRSEFSKPQILFIKHLRNLAYKLSNQYPAGDIPPEKDFTLIPRVARLINKINKILRSNKPPFASEIPMVADIGKSRHVSGTALDVVGNFSKISKAINYIKNNLSQYITIGRHFYEDYNKAYHININGIIMPTIDEFRREILKFQNITSPGLVKIQSLSSRAADPKTERFIDSLEEKYLGKPTNQPQQTIPATNTGRVPARSAYTAVGIQPGVRLNKLILDAWKTLKIFLPKSAKMTSGARTPEDQMRILRNYWKKATGKSLPSYFNNLPPDRKEWNQISQLLKKHHGYIVGPPVTKSKNTHLTGRAFDVSGADLEEIARIARFVSKSKLPVEFSQILIEDKQNNVHISVRSAAWDPVAVREVASNTSFASSVLSLTKNAISLEDLKEQMGFGIPDDPGDYFEKSPMFRHREEVPNYEIHDSSDSEARQLAKDDPEKFFYQGLHKEYPKLEALALGHMIEDNAKFYFVFKYHEREEEDIKDLLLPAAEKLCQQDARAFFYYHLHHEFPELGRGAIVQLIDNNPDSFFDLGLQKDYPDFEESANNSRNIKDPNKVELEVPEWLDKNTDKPLSIRERSAAVEKRVTNDTVVLEKDPDDTPPLSQEEEERAKKLEDMANRASEIEYNPSVGNIDLEFDQQIDMRYKDKIHPKNVIRYFLFHHYERDKYKYDNDEMIMKLLDIKPSVFFDLALFDKEEFKELAPRAAFHVAYLEPEYFLKYILNNFENISQHKQIALDRLKIPEAQRKQELENRINPESPFKYAQISKRAVMFGAWFNRKSGQLLHTGNLEHFEFVGRHPDIFSLDEEEAAGVYRSDQKVSEKIFSNWMRVAGYGSEFAVETTNFSNSDLYKLQDFLLSKNLKPGYIMISSCSDKNTLDCQNISANYRDFMTAGSIRDLNALKMASISKCAGRDPSDPLYGYFITDEDIKRIYELEYKLFELSKREYLEDPANIKKQQYEEQLSRLLNKAIEKLYHQFGAVLVQWYNDAGVGNNEEMLKYIYGPDAKTLLDLRKETSDYIKDPQKYKLNDALILFTRALQAAHSSGIISIDYLTIERQEDDPNKTMNLSPREKYDMLTGLSEGEGTDEWKEEISRISSKVISKRASQLDYPQKMYENILSWIKDNSQRIKRKLLFLKGEDVVENIFRIDIKDTMQYRKHEWIPLALSFEQSNGFHDVVVVKFHRDDPFGLGGSHHYDPDTGEHEINIYDTLDQIKDNEISVTLKHELIHMMQAIISYLIYSKQFFFGESGYSGYAGIPGKFREDRYLMYGREPIVDMEAEKQKHRLSDVEFFPRLNDEIEYVKSNINNESELIKHISGREFFQDLKKYQPEKYQKALRELYRAFIQFKSNKASLETIAKKKKEKNTGAVHKAPKKWWDKMVKKIKEDNPDYSEERVSKTVGDIWYNELSDKKRREIYKRHGKTKDPNQ